MEDVRETVSDVSSVTQAWKGAGNPSCKFRRNQRLPLSLCAARKEWGNSGICLLHSSRLRCAWWASGNGLLTRAKHKRKEHAALDAPHRAIIPWWDSSSELLDHHYSLSQFASLLLWEDTSHKQLGKESVRLNFTGYSPSLRESKGGA